jgi:tRNA/tmRNA/rRNA uracil-C5-methylase (TrmA/RlmC/RlmD family)
MLVRNVRVGKPAHQGACVARVDGTVVFIRGTAPGELVDVEIDQELAKFSRGHATAIHQPHPQRRVAPCPLAGRCGGCDWMHLAPAAQRDLKGQVVAEQLFHLAGVKFDGFVESAAASADVRQPQPGQGSKDLGWDDLGWRSRMRYTCSANGLPSLHEYRSDRLVELPDGCLIAHPSISTPPPGEPGSEILAAATADGPVFSPAEGLLTEEAGGRSFRVALDGFWQPHLAAPQILTEALLTALQPTWGASAADLYCGVGVFAAALADSGCRVWGVEANKPAAAAAEKNVPEAHFIAQDVAKALRRLPKNLDIVVLDPPRSGAGAKVMESLCALAPATICYVACDPLALARDLSIALKAGYQLSALRAFDLFPNTHHLECLAVIRR